MFVFICSKEQNTHAFTHQNWCTMSVYDTSLQYLCSYLSSQSVYSSLSISQLRGTICAFLYIQWYIYTQSPLSCYSHSMTVGKIVRWPMHMAWSGGYIISSGIPPTPPPYPPAHILHNPGTSQFPPPHPIYVPINSDDGSITKANKFLYPCTTSLEFKVCVRET
jgi:hypothetical protein